jgi:hypothetical protein
MPNLNMMTGGAGVGSARELAEMLRQMGRGKDKVLAHITPEEADMLIQAGGSGSINPNTGLPEFQPMDDYSLAEDFENLPDMQETAPIYNIQPYQPPMELFTRQPSYEPETAEFTQLSGMEPVRVAQPGVRPLQPAAMPQIARAGVGEDVPPSTEPSFLQKFEKFAKDRPVTTRLAGAGTNLLLSGLLARRAGREREAFAQELRQSAQPYAQAQQEALQRAQGGGMTAAQQRAFDIAQARARQGLSAQNLGTGSAAAGIQSGQAARARSLARQESFDEALNLAKIRDSYLREAARQELQADADLANALVGVLQGEIREATTTQATAPQQTTRR